MPEQNRSKFQFNGTVNANIIGEIQGDVIQNIYQSHSSKINTAEEKKLEFTSNSAINKLVILTLGEGDFKRGFLYVTAQIWSGGDRPIDLSVQGQLPPAPNIPKVYQKWQDKVHAWLGVSARFEKKLDLVTKVSKAEVNPIITEELTQPFNTLLNKVSDRLGGLVRLEKKSLITQVSKVEVDTLTKKLAIQLNKWLDSRKFRSIENILRDRLQLSDEVRLIIQTDSTQLQRLPWHLWDFFENRPQTEIALSFPSYERPLIAAPSRTQIRKVRILSILGDSQGINLEKDKQLLAQINAETLFLEKPNRQQLDAQLWDSQGWDILCFSGHSSSTMDGSRGYININQTDEITIPDLKNSLRTAIKHGLQLAIFNSCDGLGLARELAELHIPQIIVMREPVPDVVAQEFLKNFLTAFAGGKSFYLAVREAREKLQSLEQHYPCATWLPVICQNPAEVPPMWDSLGGV